MFEDISQATVKTLICQLNCFPLKSVVILIFKFLDLEDLIVKL